MVARLPAIVQPHNAAGTAPDACGAPSRLPDALAAAVIARRESGPGRAVLRELESDPTSLVPKALARLGRVLGLLGSRGNALVLLSANLTEKHNTIAFEGDDHPKTEQRTKRNAPPGA